MKKLIIAVIVFIGFAVSQSANAQVRISLNIGSQPAWGPTGYDYAQYYYLPAYNVYYDVTNARFFYPSGRRWITATTLPATFGRVDLYNTYKVVVDRNYVPYRDNRQDIAAYGKYKNMHNQAIIRDSRDSKYYQSRYHPMHDQWAKQHPSNNRRTNRGRTSHR